MAEMGATDAIVRAFKEAAGGQNYFETWNALVSTMGAFLASSSPKDHAWLNERADAAMSALPERTRDAMQSLCDAVVDAFESEPGQDLLGDAYMRIGIGSRDNGQFFTPYHLSALMSRLGLEKQIVFEEIERRGYVTINDPAAGGGSTLIAASQTLLNMGVNYQQHVLFMASELSELTAITCFVQMSLLGMPGIVSIGDSLRMESRMELWTPMLSLDETWMLRMVGRVVFST